MDRFEVEESGCLEKSRFLRAEEIHPTLYCGINLGVMNNPLRTPCDHLFCARCIHQWLGYNQTCPSCRASLEKGMLKKDRNIESIVNDLEIRCAWFEKGCEWTGKLESYWRHEEDGCPFALHTCPFKDCNQMIRRQDFAAHTSTCEYRNVVCEHCGSSTQQKKLQDHVAVCPLAPVPCLLHCGAQVPRGEMSAHLEEHCPRQPVPCPVPNCRPHQPITRSSLESHLSASQGEHLLLLSQALHSLQTEVKELRDWKAKHQVRSIRSGAPRVHILEGHTDAMNCLQFDDRLLVSGSLDKTIRVWDLAKWECIHLLSGHTATVWCIQFKDDVLVSGSGDATLRVWSLTSGACLQVLTGHRGDVYCLEYDGRKAVSGSRDQTVRVWDLQTGTCLNVLTGHLDYVLAVRFKDDTVVSCSSDNLLMMWSLRLGQCVRALKGHQDSVWCLHFEEDCLVSGSDDNTLRVWDLQTGNCKHVLAGHTDHVYCLQLCLSHGLVVSGSDDKTVRVWDLNTGECRQVMKGHSSSVWCLQTDGTTLVSGSGDGTIGVWDVQSGVCLRQLRGHTNTVIRCYFRGNRIGSCSSDGTVRVWDFNEDPSQ